jgi:hypothetical protein
MTAGPLTPDSLETVMRSKNMGTDGYCHDDKAHYQAFFWVLIDLIVELLCLIIQPFDNQTES